MSQNNQKDVKKQLYTLTKNQQMSPQALQRGLQIAGIIPGKTSWKSFLQNMLLAYGSLFLLCGIIFFFAYNWNEMGKFLKLGSIQFFIILTAGYAFYKKLKTYPAKIALMSASVFIGIFLAIYGQVYQLTANASSFFIFWALLIFGFVILSDFLPLYLLLNFLIQIAFVLYCKEKYIYLFDETVITFTFIAFCNLLFLGLFEFFSYKISWVKGKTTPRLLYFLSVFSLTVSVLIYILSGAYKTKTDIFPGFSVLFYLILLGASFYYYQKHKKDMLILFFNFFSIIIIINISLINEMLHSYKDISSTALVISLLLIGEGSLVGYIMKKINQKWENCNEDK